MARLRAVVLAAGRGVRMGGETPKTLLPLGDQRPLLHYILGGLRKAGVDDLLIVTGHRPEQVMAFATSEWGEDNLTFVRNARFASWGNFHTVRVALDQSPGMDVLVVNSDVIVPPDVYLAVAAKPGDLVVAVQKRFTLDDEDMRVHLDGDRIRAISKHLKKAFSHGEFVGVSLLRPEAARLYAGISNAAEWKSDTTIYYEDVFDRMIGSCDVRAAFVEPGQYAEVDVPDDVPGALAVVEKHRAAFE